MYVYVYEHLHTYVVLAMYDIDYHNIIMSLLLVVSKACA